MFVSSLNATDKTPLTDFCVWGFVFGFRGGGVGLGEYSIFSIGAFGCWHFGISVLSWDLSFHKSTHLTCTLKTCELQKGKQISDRNSRSKCIPKHL